jgi:hypothetical protein
VNKKILYISSFLGSPKRHGGTRRSEQIFEILKEINGVELIVLSNAMTWKEMLSRHIWTCLLCFSKAMLGALKLMILRTLSLRGGVFYVLYGGPIIHCLRSGKIDLIVMETVHGASMVVADIIKKTGVPYIVVPHNIEFLVAGQTDISFCSAGNAFNWEINIYKGALQTIAISEFDATILRCFDIKVDVLPYYPTEDILKNIEITRKRRTDSTKDLFLILGTVDNTPTRIGTERLLTQINTSKEWKIKFIVAGYGSEQLKSFENHNIEVRGSVSDDELNNLIVSALCVVIQQPQTTGFMTKLTELNLSEVPVYVIGNYEQAKYLENYGIFLVNSIDEISVCQTQHAQKIFQRPLFKFEI